MTDDSPRVYPTRPIATPEDLGPDRRQARIARTYRRFFAGRVEDAERAIALAARAARFGEQEGRISGMMTAPIEQAPRDESALVTRLVESFVAAKAAQADSPDAYLPGADWKVLIETEWAEPLKAFERRDVDAIAEFSRNFFRNAGVTGFWGNTDMFEGFARGEGLWSIKRAEVMQQQFDTWRELFPDVPTSELDAPAVGNPWGYVIDGQLLYEPVCEYHYHASYARRLLSATPSPVVLEIGGGFGGLAYQLMKNGTDLTYIGLDLPEATFLQAYYLSSALPHLKVRTFRSPEERITVEMLQEYDVILMPNFMLPQVDSGLVDLALNVRSLAEMPAETIAEYLAQLDRIGPLFVFHENIYKARVDELHGIPSSEFPELENFVLVAENESRWPHYDRNSGYPCHENLFLNRSLTGK